MSDSDVEIVRRGLMMRDTGFGNPEHLWEQVGSLLKERDHLRAAFAEARELIERAVAWCDDFDIDDAWTQDSRAFLERAVNTPQEVER